jgi:hypothetical protein
MIKSGWMRWAGYVVRIRERGNVYKMLVGMPEGKTQYGRTRYG